MLGLVLRWCGMDWGLPGDQLPFPLHPDEATNVGAPRRMLENGTLNPEFFNYGSLYSYLVLSVLWIGQILGLLSTDADYILAGRGVTLVCGLLTIPVIYSMGRMVFDNRTGLLAAAFYGMAPGLIMHGAFATVDVPATFFASLCYWGALRALQTGTPGPLLFGSVCCGLAAATKYPVGMVGLSLLAVAGIWLREASDSLPKTSRVLGAMALGCCVGFLAGCPYALLDFQRFWDHAGGEMLRHSLRGHGFVFADTGNGWWFVFSRNLPYAFGMLTVVGGLVGAGLMIRARSHQALVLLAFAIPYFVLMGFIELRFMRYVLPLAPVLLIPAGHVAAMIWRGLGRLQAVGLVGLAAMASPAIVQAIGYQSPDARIEALAFGFSSMEPGDTVAMIYPEIFLEVPFASVPKFNPRGTDGDIPIRITALKGLSAERLLASQAEWVSLSEFWWAYGDPDKTEQAQEFWKALEANYELVFAVSGGISQPMRQWFGPFEAPHDWSYPFMEQRIYRRVGQRRPAGE